MDQSTGKGKYNFYRGRSVIDLARDKGCNPAQTNAILASDFARYDISGMIDDAIEDLNSGDSSWSGGTINIPNGCHSISRPIQSGTGVGGVIVQGASQLSTRIVANYPSGPTFCFSKFGNVPRSTDVPVGSALTHSYHQTDFSGAPNTLRYLPLRETGGGSFEWGGSTGVEWQFKIKLTAGTSGNIHSSYGTLTVRTGVTKGVEISYNGTNIVALVTTNAGTVTTSVACSTNAWHHISVTANCVAGTCTLKIYIDGTLGATATGAGDYLKQNWWENVAIGPSFLMGLTGSGTVNVNPADFLLAWFSLHQTVVHTSNFAAPVDPPAMDALTLAQLTFGDCDPDVAGSVGVYGQLVRHKCVIGGHVGTQYGWLVCRNNDLATTTQFAGVEKLSMANAFHGFATVNGQRRDYGGVGIYTATALRCLLRDLIITDRTGIMMTFDSYTSEVENVMFNTSVVPIVATKNVALSSFKRLHISDCKLAGIFDGGGSMENIFVDAVNMEYGFLFSGGGQFACSFNIDSVSIGLESIMTTPQAMFVFGSAGLGNVDYVLKNAGLSNVSKDLAPIWFLRDRTASLKIVGGKQSTSSPACNLGFKQAVMVRCKSVLRAQPAGACPTRHLKPKAQAHQR
jgi:hypothetical protein